MRINGTCTILILYLFLPFDRILHLLNVWKGQYYLIKYLIVENKFDWRQYGAVTEVKNREFCRSDWAFATTGTIEAQWFLKTGHLISLSEQNLIDCSYEYGNNGCLGGVPDYSFEYIEKNGGINIEEDYPYEGEEHYWCRFNSSRLTVKINSWQKMFLNGNENFLKLLLKKIGPLVIGINLQKSFYNYTGGIYYDENCTNFIDYLILLIGFGTDYKTSQDYWILKNSMGADWGENGYMRIVRNKNNHCGVASYVAYPIL